MQKFEYATIAFDSGKLFGNSKLDHEAFYKRLNAYGAEGWELVNVFPITERLGMTHEVTAVFKRPLALS